MRIFDRKIPLILLLGDVLCFLASLWLTLLIRYGELPTGDIFVDHLIPFSFLFVIWVIVFFIAGLYEKPNTIFRTKLRQILVNVQVVNALIAIVFFYFTSSSIITPKTNLLIYIFVSLVLIFWWRTYGYYLRGARRQEDALLIGSGVDADNLKEEVNKHSHYNLRFAKMVDINTSTDPLKEIMDTVSSAKSSVFVVDFHNEKIKPLLPSLYNLIFSKIRFIDMERVYEDVFDRVPLSMLRESWFLEHVPTAPRMMYDALKRLMDTTVSLILGIATLPLYPFIALFIKLEDGGPVFIFQNRIGKDNRMIRIPKFRSMRTSDAGEWVKEVDVRITKVGSFLRKSRLDELPQLWSIVKGDLSLIGPRPDIEALGLKLSAEIPYYNIRSTIKPGLSGWAQIKQDLPPQSIEETKLRLAYDFYYIKNRSVVLDFKIALKTLKTLLSRTGK